jgi:peptidoglycan hydrolase-like protein with peptidoglycan-binding domain
LEKPLSKKCLLAIAIPLLTFVPTVALAETSPDSGTLVTTVEEVNPGIALKHSLTFTKKPKATEKFWNKLAWCETHGDWKNGGNWAGGLGIAQSTWYGYGGHEFAKSPHLATKAEQIVVANRISTQGYLQITVRDADWARRQGVPSRFEFYRYPVGFNGWGALHCVGSRKPKLFHYDDFKQVAKVPYRLNERGIMVRDLQTLLNVKVDGDYGLKTRAAHIKFLKKRGITTKGIIPELPIPDNQVSKASGRVSSQSVKIDKSCPRYEKLLKQYGLPVKDFSYIMWRESKCQTMAVGWNYKSGFGPGNCKLAPAKIYKNCRAVRSYDTGLLQVNSTWRTVTAQVCNRPQNQVIRSLTDPVCNIKVAKYLYENGGMHHWRGTSGKK